MRPHGRREGRPSDWPQAAAAALLRRLYHPRLWRGSVVGGRPLAFHAIAAPAHSRQGARHARICPGGFFVDRCSASRFPRTSLRVRGFTGADRLGRSLIDLLDTIQHLEACGVDLYLDQQAIDTTTPMGKLVFQVTGAFAEFERTMIRQRVKAGLKRAVAQGVRLGRPKIDSATERKVRKQLANGVGILKVAKSLGIGTGTVQRIAKERAISPRGAQQ